MLRTKQPARRPVAEANSGRNQPVAHLGKRKNAQGGDGRQFEQLPTTLPLEFLVFESSDHIRPPRWWTNNSLGRGGARPAPLCAETRHLASLRKSGAR